MRVLVTGASGHLGSFLAKRLLEDGHEVAALVRPASDLWRLGDDAARLTLIRGDLNDVASARDAIRSFGAATVVHSAWNGITADARDSHTQLTTNVIGTLQLFDAAREGGCSSWIGLGSQAEYGRYDELLQEDAELYPTSAYGIAKHATRLLLEKAAQLAGIRFVWLRLVATYGPKDDARHLIPSVIRQLLERRIPPLTAGTQLWDYLYIDDAVEAIYRTATSPGVHGIFNLASGASVAVRDIALSIRDLVDTNAQLALGAIPYGDGAPISLRADITRLQRAIDWTPRVTLAEGLRRTVDWHIATHSNRQQTTLMGTHQ
jgi:nucleoside-diphosphate-sugar epimerase